MPETVTAGPISARSADPSLFNADLAPVPLEKRTWKVYDYASLWVAMSVCIPTYMLASGLIAGGMNWWQAVGTILLGNLIVLVPMLLNAHAGTKYGIPFPVLVRASFGVRGANLPALLRALVACGWFGIQTWIGGQAIASMLRVVWPGSAAHPETIWVCFFAFWLLNMFVIWKGIDTIRAARRHRGAAHARRRHSAALVDHQQGWRTRPGFQRSRKIPRQRRVLSLLHPVADRDGRILVHRRAQYSRFHPIRRQPARAGCSVKRWVCRRP